MNNNNLNIIIDVLLVFYVKLINERIKLDNINLYEII